MPYDQLFEQAGRQFNVDPALLRAQMLVESSGDPKAQSEKGAQGLMQLIPETQKALGVTDPSDPQQSIFAAAKLMAENLDRYGNVADAVKAYHGGTDKANWGPKTQAYVSKVLNGYGAPAQAATAAPGAQQPHDDLAADFASPATPQVAPVDDLMSDFAPTGKATTTAAQATAPAPNAAAPAPQAAPGMMDSLASGDIPGFVKAYGAQGISNANAIGRGLMDVLDEPSEWAALGAEKSGLTGLLAKAGINMPTEAQQIQMNKDSRADFSARNPEAGVQGMASRVGGNILGTASPIGLAGKGLAAGGNALLGAVRSAPAVAGAAPALQAAGNFVAGNSGMLSRMANLGAQGATGAALLSGASDTPLGEQMAVGGALGMAIPPVAGAIRAGAGTLKALAQPFYDGGQTAVAQNTLQRLAGKGPITPDLTEYVPGSTPTLAQATKNPMLAALERSSESSAPLEFGAIKEANNAARVAHLDKIRGDSSTLAAAIDARDTQALPLLSKAMQGANPANPSNVIKTIDDILESPKGQQDAVSKALTQVRNKLVPGGKLTVTDPEQLYGIRKSINDQLETVAGRDNSAAALASKELIDVRNSLDEAIEGGAPGFRQYLKDYAELSKPVSAQNYLQSINLMDAAGERVTLPRVSAELSRIEKLRKKPGANDAKSITDDQLEALRSLKKDLVRESYSNTLGKSAGSNTKQNLAMDNLMQSALPGALGKLPLGPELLGSGIGGAIAGPVGAGYGAAAGNALRQGMAAQNPEIQNRLIELLINPKTVLAAPQSVTGNALLQRTGALGATAISRDGGKNN
jgi:hypothetical protein